MANLSFTDTIAELLRDGYTERFRANGNSMQPTIKDGEVIMIKPVVSSQIKRGDIVFYQNHNGVIAHRVVAIKAVNTKPSAIGDQETGGTSILNPQSSIFRTFFILRGDASSTCDEPVEADQVLGKVVFVERARRLIDLDGWKSTILYTAHLFRSRFKTSIIRSILWMETYLYDPDLKRPIN
jgi:signal peptidase I